MQSNFYKTELPKDLSAPIKWTLHLQKKNKTIHIIWITISNYSSDYWLDANQRRKYLKCNDFM